MMTIYTNYDDENSAELCAEILANGGTIIYPTETLYGLGGISTDEQCYRSILRIKKRPPAKPFPVLVRDINMLNEYAIVDDIANILIDNFWPGPLTLILNIRKNVFPDIADTSNSAGTVGFRISSNLFVKKLFKLIDKPIISTSANISGDENIYTFEDLKAVFAGKVDLIINSGTISASKGSTIVDCTVNPPKIVRDGDIPKNIIYQLTGYGNNIGI